MQKQKFKVNDKVKIISTAFGLQGEIGTVEVVDAIYGSNYCRVSANTEVCYTSQEIDIGRFGTNSWRYGFYEHELELVEDKPKFKVGDKVRCVDGYSSLFVEGEEYVVEECYWNCGCNLVKVRCDWSDCGWDVSRFELVKDEPARKFKVGDRVRCVDDTYNDGFDLIAGKEYTICGLPRGLVRLNTGDDWFAYRFELVTDQEVSKPEPEFSVGDKVLLMDCLAEVVSVKQYDTTTLIGVKQGSCFFMVHPHDLQHYKQDEAVADKLTVTVKLDDNIRTAITQLENRIEYLLSKEPSYAIGQEVYVAAGITRDLKRATIIDAVPREGLLKVNVSGFDCFVEEERVYTREETKGD